MTNTPRLYGSAVRKKMLGKFNVKWSVLKSENTHCSLGLNFAKRNILDIANASVGMARRKIVLLLSLLDNVCNDLKIYSSIVNRKIGIRIT